MFKIGDKLVCVDDSNQKFQVLKKGDIYTYRGSCPFNGIYVMEIVLPHHHLGFEMSIREDRLIKVEDNFAEQVLENILKQVKEKELINI